MNLKQSCFLLQGLPPCPTSNQLMVNWLFGIPMIPLWQGLLLGEVSRKPNPKPPATQTTNWHNWPFPMDPRYLLRYFAPRDFCTLSKCNSYSDPCGNPSHRGLPLHQKPPAVSVKKPPKIAASCSFCFRIQVPHPQCDSTESRALRDEDWGWVLDSSFQNGFAKGANKNRLKMPRKKRLKK